MVKKNREKRTYNNKLFKPNEIIIKYEHHVLKFNNNRTSEEKNPDNKTIAEAFQVLVEHGATFSKMSTIDLSVT